MERKVFICLYTLARSLSLPVWQQLDYRWATLYSLYTNKNNNNNNKYILTLDHKVRGHISLVTGEKKIPRENNLKVEQINNSFFRREKNNIRKNNFFSVGCCEKKKIKKQHKEQKMSSLYVISLSEQKRSRVFPEDFEGQGLWIIQVVTWIFFSSAFTLDMYVLVGDHVGIFALLLLACYVFSLYLLSLFSPLLYSALIWRQGGIGVLTHG